MKWFCKHQGLIAHAEAGWASPTMSIQLSPFSWGIGICCYYKSRKKALTGQIGPLSFSVELTGFGLFRRSWPGNEYNSQIWEKNKGWKPSNEWFDEVEKRQS